MNDKLIRTPWFAGHLKPTRTGIYERDYSNESSGAPSSHFCYYDVEKDYWSISFDSVKAVLRAEFRGKSYTQNLPWRGVVEQEPTITEIPDEAEIVNQIGKLLQALHPDKRLMSAVLSPVYISQPEEEVVTQAAILFQSSTQEK